MSISLKNYLQESYLLNNNSVEETLDFIKNNQDNISDYKYLFQNKYYDSFVEEKLFVKGPENFLPTELNHAIFAQAMIDDTKNGFHGKTAQLLLRTLSTSINNGTINPYQLAKIFNTQQGLIEVPIHLILYIGGLYDFYYHEESYKPDEKINFSKINGITGANGKDILDNDILNGINIARYIFDNDSLKGVTSNFIQPVTPKFVDDHMLTYNDSYESTRVAKNYRESYFDYTLGKEIPLSNNISSQIPVYGYGNLNNYLNTMHHFFFGKGIDGNTDQSQTSLNENGIPYHIIGNFNGRLKTIKTYEDSNINFLASYNSYGQKVKYDLTNIVTEFNSVINGLQFNDEFLYGESFNSKKIEFFLLLSKLKANLLGGYSLTSDIGLIIRSLCATNVLSATQNGKPIPDFIAMLLYAMYQPSGKEPNNPNLIRPNKQTKILDTYHVDIDGYNGYIDANGNYIAPSVFIQNIGSFDGDVLHDYVTWYLNNEWSKEQNQDETSKVRKLDDKGVFVVYPSAGGDQNLINILSEFDGQYTKTNVVSKVITDSDKSASNYLKNLKKDENYFYGDNNDIELNYVGFNEKQNNLLVFDYIKNKELTNLVSLNNSLLITNNDMLKEDGGVDNTTFDFFNPSYYSGENQNSLISLGYFEKYDDIFLSKGITQDNTGSTNSRFFNNRSLFLNTPRMFWFEKPTYQNETYIGEMGVDNKPTPYNGVVDSIELKHYSLKGLLGYDNFFTRYGDSPRELTYKDFKPGYGLYTYFESPDISNYEVIPAQSDQRGDFDTLSAKSLIDIFGVDKLEDFRALFNYFADTKTRDYMSDVFGTFNFKSLLKHTNIFGYKHLPNDISFNGKVYTKDEIFALLTGYSGMFMDFASRTGISKVINSALTMGQRVKAEVVVHEFMGTKITVNNHSIGGPLKIENTAFNPTGLRYSTALFEPIFAFSNQTRDYKALSETLGDKLLFRTLLFGSQSINPYTVTNEQDSLIKKYVQFKGLTKGLSLTLNEDFVINELTKTFFRNLNIELNEGNLQLLVGYVRNYIKHTLSKNSVFNKGKYNETILYGGYDIDENPENLPLRYGDRTSLASKVGDEGNQDLIVGYDGKTVVAGEIINGVYKQTPQLEGKLNVLVDKFEDLNAITNFNNFIKLINENLTTRLLETVNTSFRNLKEKLDVSEGSLTFDPNSADKSTAAQKIDESISDTAYRDLKAGMYYRIKTLYDKNVAFNNVDINDDTLIKQFSYELGTINPNDILNNPLFFNFNTQQNDICDENTRLIPNKKSKDLFDYVSILDRGNNDYGTKVLVDIVNLQKEISDDITNMEKIDTVTGRSMWSVLSKLAGEHEFLLLPLSSYINLNGAVKESAGVDGAFELAHDMFGVFKDLEMWESNPAFIFQLGSLTSNIKDSNKEKNSANLGYDLSDTFCLDLDVTDLRNISVTDEKVPADVKNSNVTSFIVDFGNKNQNMFQNIQISTEEFTNTEESIKAAVSLASDSIPTLSSGKLFSAMESRSYSCTVTSLGNATIQPLSYFFLRNVPLFYGTYWITNVSHRITPNNMITTFKGVRQPITKKPTANATVITYLLKRANERFLEFGGLTRNDETPIATSGKIYINRGFTTGEEGINNDKLDTKGYGLVYQEGTTETGKYVTYNGIWVVGSYLKLLTGGDETDKLLIKTFISYLLNNAIEISRLDNNSVSYQFTDVGSYMIDVIAYDLANKLGRSDLSLSSLIDEYNTTPGDVYETMLTELSSFGDDAQKIFDYLKATDDEFYYPSKALVTGEDSKVVGNSEKPPKITFPSEINDEKRVNLHTRVNAWISEQTPSWDMTLHGFSTYGLTNLVFKTAKVSDGSELIYPLVSRTNSLMGTGIPKKMELVFYDVSPVKKSVVFLNGGGDYVWEPYSYRFNLINYFETTTNKTAASDWLRFKNNLNNSTQFITPPLDVTLFTGLVSGKDYKVILLNTYENGKTEYRDLQASSTGRSAVLLDVNKTMSLPANPISFKAKDVSGSETVVPVGSQSNGDYIFDKAVRTKYVLKCDDPKNETEYNVRVMGSWGKTKKYLFLKNTLTSESKEFDTIGRSEYAFVNQQILGKFDDEAKMKDWTIRDVTETQTSNVYVAPTLAYSSFNSEVPIGKPINKTPLVRTSKFGPRNGRTHKGVDLDLVTGDPVYASYDGVVIAAGLLNPEGYGNVVIIKHEQFSGGIMTLYGHLSRIDVPLGSSINVPVKAGQQIGLGGGDANDPGHGSSSGSHLHYEIAEGVVNSYGAYFDLKRVDPWPYLEESARLQSSNSGSTGSKPTGPNSDFWKLVTICAGENFIDQPQGMADVAQSIYNRVNIQGGYGKTISEVIMKEGQYEPTFATRSLWQAIKDEDTAIKAYMATKGVNREEAAKRIKTAADAITNPTLKANAATFVGSRTEFLAAPPTSGDAVGVVEREPKAKNNAFFWNYQGKTTYYNNNNLSATKIPSSISSYV